MIGSISCASSVVCDEAAAKRSSSAASSCATSHSARSAASSAVLSAPGAGTAATPSSVCVVSVMVSPLPSVGIQPRAPRAFKPARYRSYVLHPRLKQCFLDHRLEVGGGDGQQADLGACEEALDGGRHLADGEA